MIALIFKLLGNLDDDIISDFDLLLLRFSICWIF